MRNLYLFIWLLATGVTDRTYGQTAPQLQWALSAADQFPNAGEVTGKTIVTDVAGNRYIAGRFQMTTDFDPSPNTFNLTATYKDLYYDNDSGDIYFAKYDPNGNLLWVKTIGGPDTFYGGDSPLTISLDNNGNIILSGYMGSLFDFDPSEAVVNLDTTIQNAMFLAKYDSEGNYLWAFAIPGNRHNYPIALSLDSTGNMYLAGFVLQPADFDPSEATETFPSGSSGTSSAYFVAKYNPEGDFLWVKALSGTSTQNLINMTVNASGQIILIGDFFGTVDFDPSPATANLTALSTDNFDGYIAKYDTNGNYLWAKSMGGTDASVSTSAVAVGLNGQIHAIGFFSGTVNFNPSGARDTIAAISVVNFFITKYDTNGNYLWTKAINGADELYKFDFQNISINPGGQIYIAGNFQETVDFDPSTTTANLTALGSRDFFIAKYNPNGDYLWAKSIGGTDNEYLSAIKLDVGGNINITGNFGNIADFDPSPASQNLTSVGNMDVFIAKYNSEGTFLNAGIIGGYPTGNSSENENKVTLDSTGAIYAAGTFSQKIDFDPSPQIATLTSENDGNDIFIAKYTPTGSYLWVKSIKGINSETMSLSSTTTDANGNLYIAGYFFGTVDFDPSNNTAPLTSVGFGDLFIAKYDSNGNYLWAKTIGKTSNYIDSNTIKSIATDSNGNLYISGHFYNSLDFDPSAASAVLTAVQFQDIFFAKYNTSGNYIWAKAIGGNWYDKSNALHATSSGNIFIAGSFSDTVDFDPSPAVTNLMAGGQNAMYFAAYDTNGNFIWVKGFTGLDYGEFESIAVNQSGQLYLSGKFVGSVDFDPSENVAIQTSIGSINSFIAKYNSNGSYLWAKPISGSSMPNVNTIALDSEANPIIAGDFGVQYQSPGTTITFDPVIPGTTFTTLGGRDLFLAKYDINGNYLWAKTAGGLLDETVSSMAMNSNGEMIVTGSFMLTSDFDPSETTFNLTSINGSDMFLAKYKECRPIPVTVTRIGNALIATTSADSYQWVDCNNHNTPITGATNALFTPSVSGNYAVVITAGGCRSTSGCQTYLSVNSALAQSVLLYPNPSSGIFKVTLPYAYEKTTVRVSDLTGKTIKEWNFETQQEFEISLEAAANGIYFVQLRCDDETAVFKVIKN
ncbi:hypothetical protein FLJC2902T_11180 [Flavobacterium limnosediminis JC2902]|uniref:Secretion system C-terminal sorting domain-containing protein n=1 Tax=Flavobacterium limnosediminis JC2902 TaxID=1341181 RepID=V6SR13_9FLAO|nr:T9SS type A sorting domain-containing protein [Flavobacterium limnosediminis]ESU29081.1 hypothetical protein FLJC2902T_11180 [Flavobacterium limnosediminis JC2902]